MRSCRSTKKRNIPIQLFAIVYLLLCIVSQLTSPTSAAFNDTKMMDGTISAATDFGEDKKQVRDEQHDPNNDTDKQAVTNSTDQDHDETSANQTSEQPNSEVKEDSVSNQPSEEGINQSAPVTDETTDETPKPETSDQSSQMDQETVEDDTAGEPEAP